MERVNLILKNKKFTDCMKAIEAIEAGREFCHHDLSHSIDVARITLLLAHEAQLPLEGELVYGAALLHDIGRSAPKKDHRSESARLAAEILAECEYDKYEINSILDAINSHGDHKVEEEMSFRGLFYKADKLSRRCFCCKAARDCYWDDDKKNNLLTI